MRTITKIIPALVLAGLVVLFSTAAAADEDNRSVEVRTIVAAVDGDSFDDDLEDLRGQLERGFEGYTSFRQINQQSRKLGDESPARFRLPTEDRLELTYHGRAGEFVKLGLSIEDRLSTTLRATPGSTFFQAGLRHEEGILILAITVR